MKTLQDAAMKSWQTTAAGWAGFVGALAFALNQLWDGKPETNPEWGLVVAAFMGAIGLTMARDNGKSSEDTGAK